MTSPAKGNKKPSKPWRTVVFTCPPALRSERSSVSISRRNSGSFRQASSSRIARCSDGHSAARWNNSLICAQRSGVTRHLPALHFVVKPCFRHSQLTPHGDRRNIQRLGFFIHGEPAE